MKKGSFVVVAITIIFVTLFNFNVFAANERILNEQVGKKLEEVDLLKLTLEDIQRTQSTQSYNLSESSESIRKNIEQAYINFEKLKEYDKQAEYINKLSVLDMNTIAGVIEQENLNNKDASSLIRTWVENDNFGKSTIPEYDFLVKEPPLGNNNPIAIASYSGEPKLIGNSNDLSGVHYIVKSVNQYNKATGYINLPTVTLKSSTSDPDVPYAHFGIYTSTNTVGLDLGTYYKQSDGKWRFFVSGYAHRSGDSYTKYYKEIPGIAYSPSQITNVYFIAEAVKGSSYDTYRLTAINGSNWATIGTITVSTNEKGYSGEAAPNKSHLNSNYSNVRMHREVTLAHAKQANRRLTGSTIVGANWYNVYIYSPTSTSLWGTSQTLTVERVGQTTAYANTVKYSIKSKWSQDIVDILYK